MRIKTSFKRTGERGIAVFIVLISVAVLGGMAAIFSMQMKVETKLAMNSSNENDMEWLGRSGVELACYVLAMEKKQPGPGQRFTTLNQKWAGGDADTNELLMSIQMKDVPCGDGKYSVTIKDAESKLNINTAAFNPAMMNEALIVMGTDASEIPGIIASIEDWIDPDDQTHPNGAESEYYGTLNPPYAAKNGPIDDLSELLLVKGITPELYWGPSYTNHSPGIFQSRNPLARGGVIPIASLVSAGLVDVFTPISEGHLNINTCSALELRMIGMDESTANHVIALRQGPSGNDGGLDSVPFNNPGEINNVGGIPPQLVQTFIQYLTVDSFTFEVQVDVEIAQSRRTYHAVVRRNGTDPHLKILSFRWD
jgi:general secretion pathway protein K